MQLDNRTVTLARILGGGSIIQRTIMLGLMAVFLSTGIGAAVLSGSGSAHAAGKTLDWNNRKIVWLPFERGLRQARHSGVPVVVVFYAEWCSHCASFSRQFFHPAVVELSKNLVMVRVDVDKHPRLAARYNPDGNYVPRTMVLRPDGSLIKSIHGSQEKYRYNLEDTTPSELVVFMGQAVELISAPR
ncbi:MAG: thioredoxin family protein [Alphaproteobacteria bacterium]